MQNRQINLLGCSILVLFLAAMVTPVLGATYTVGLDLGTTADYNVSETSGVIDRAEIEVYGILGTEITLNVSSYNETTLDHFTIYRNDVANESAYFLGFYYTVAAGLAAGDPLYPNSLLIINETITETYDGVSREINHVKVNDGTFEAWFDKETGLMVKINLWFFNWINSTLMTTTAWEPVNLLSTTNLLLIGVGVEFLVIVLLVVRRGGSKKKKKK